MEDLNDIMPPPAKTDTCSVSFCKQTAEYSKKKHKIKFRFRGFSKAEFFSRFGLEKYQPSTVKGTSHGEKSRRGKFNVGLIYCGTSHN